MEMILSGPTPDEKEQGYFSAFPEGAMLENLEWNEKGKLTLFLKIPRDFLNSPSRVCSGYDQMFQQVEKSFYSIPIVMGFHFMAFNEDEETYRSLMEWGMLKKKKPQDQIKDSSFKTVPQPPVYNVNKRQGSLTGKTVYVWPGHGYVMTTSAWATQRPNCFSYCEDYGDIETTAYYIARYCYNAGAFVVMNRERNFSTKMVIIDNEVSSTSDGNFINNGFTQGLPDTSTDYTRHYYSYSSTVSYPLTENNRPFTYGGYDHESITSSVATSNVMWVPNIPEDGNYAVYVSYGKGRDYVDPNPSTSNTADAHYTVKHGGGECEFRVNQQYHICTWVFLGEFYFYT
jgi:hypothetical protein